MVGLERLRRTLLRWDRLLVALVLGLPFFVLATLGFLWLLEHDYLLLFISLSVLAGAVVYVARRLAQRRWQRDDAAPEAAHAHRVEANPDWLPREQEAYAAARRRIEALTRDVLPWENLPEHALLVVNEVAVGMGGKRGGALAFTMPEALLLIERSASRYRDYLRAHVPFSDQVSLATLHWLWRQRERATLLWKLAHGGRRVARFALNPSVGILREIEGMIAGGNSNYLTREMLCALQAVLLEEVAYAAVELYSGRLRFSDAELLQIQLERAAADRELLATPDTPLRVLFVGQTSAGKSTLINALLDEERAETDAAATTPGLVAYEVEIEGTPCLLLDSRGLDGSTESQDALLAEMREADMIVWTLRANRPARAPDLALKQRFDAWFAARPERRKPEVIAVATGMDLLVPDWPYPEHVLPPETQRRFAEAVQAIAHDLEGLKPRPVCAVPPRWNIESVRSALGAHLGEGLLVQRNRRRSAGARRQRGLLEQARRGGRGLKQGAALIGGRLSGRPAEEKPD